MSSGEFSRVHAIIVLFLFITVMYTAEGIFLLGQEQLETADTTQLIQTPPELQDPYNFTKTDIEEQGYDPMGVIIGFIEFLGFAPLNMPIYFQAILDIVMIIVSIFLGYLIYVHVRDWIPFVGGR